MFLAQNERLRGPPPGCGALRFEPVLRLIDALPLAVSPPLRDLQPLFKEQPFIAPFFERLAMDHLPLFFVKPFNVLARLHCRLDLVERFFDLQYLEILLPLALAFLVRAPGRFIASFIHFRFAT